MSQPPKFDSGSNVVLLIYLSPRAGGGAEGGGEGGWGGH